MNIGSRLLPTSEPLKTQRVHGLPKCVCVFARLIRDLTSPTDEVSVRFFMNLCKSTFLIMC